MEIITHHQVCRSKALDHFLELLVISAFRYKASELLNFGIDENDLEIAMDRTAKVCQSAGLPVEQNVKRLYIAGSNGISCDWMLTALGRKLILLNSDPSNPFVARLQIELIRRLESTEL